MSALPGVANCYTYFTVLYFIRFCLGPVLPPGESDMHRTMKSVLLPISHRAPQTPLDIISEHDVIRETGST